MTTSSCSSRSMRMNLIRSLAEFVPMMAICPDRDPQHPELPDMPYGCKIILAGTMMTAMKANFLTAIQAAMTMTPGRNKDVLQASNIPWRHVEWLFQI